MQRNKWMKNKQTNKSQFFCQTTFMILLSCCSQTAFWCRCSAVSSPSPHRFPSENTAAGKVRKKATDKKNCKKKNVTKQQQRHKQKETKSNGKSNTEFYILLRTNLLIYVLCYGHLFWLIWAIEDILTFPFTCLFGIFYLQRGRKSQNKV